MRRPVVGVMGSGADAHEDTCRALGSALAGLGVHLLTGGGAGVMAAVSRAFWETPGRDGLVIGVLPCVPGAPDRRPAGYPNSWVEIEIATHLAARGAGGADTDSRNHINVLSSDAVVILPGGSGTASEARLAIVYERPVVALLDDADDVPGLPAAVTIVRTVRGVIEFIEAALDIRG